MSLTRAWPLFLIVVAIVVAVVYNASLDSRAEVGKAAPNFTLLTPEGHELSLSDLRGQARICPFLGDVVPDVRRGRSGLASFCGTLR